MSKLKNSPDIFLKRKTNIFKAIRDIRQELKALFGSIILFKNLFGSLIVVTRSLDYKKNKKFLQNIKKSQNYNKAIGQSHKNHELFSETIMYGFWA